MSTEQKKEHHQTSEAAERLSKGWEQFKHGKIISYRWMAIILLVVTAIGVYLYIRSAGSTADSRKWTELEEANSVKALEDFAKKYPNSIPGKVAELNLARFLVGPEGIDALSVEDESRQRKAVENVEKAREMFSRLADELKDYPAMKAECYYGGAKAEKALIGFTKDGSTDFRGSVDKLIDWLNKLAEAAPDTPWGHDAKEQAAALKNPATRDELTRTQVAIYKNAKRPAFPGSGPTAPGGLPPLGPVPGVPGGPIAPIGSTPTTPIPPVPPTSGPPAPPPMPPVTPQKSTEPPKAPSTPPPPKATEPPKKSEPPKAAEPPKKSEPPKK